MNTLRFVFCSHGGELRVGEKSWVLSPTTLAVTDARAKFIPASEDYYCFDFHVGALQGLMQDIADLLDEELPGVFRRDRVRQIKGNEQVNRVLRLLAPANPAALLRFIYVYCLGQDRRYFSALLRQSVAGDRPFCDFIEANYLNSWSVSRFAEEFGLPLRKFNLLFQEKFGVPVKRWLLVRRLEHARELLLSTSMRVFDIAAECGFGNHAHFTGSFRRYFSYSPSRLRPPAATRRSSVSLWQKSPTVVGATDMQ